VDRAGAERLNVLHLTAGPCSGCDDADRSMTRSCPHRSNIAPSPCRHLTSIGRYPQRRHRPCMDAIELLFCENGALPSTQDQNCCAGAERIRLQCSSALGCFHRPHGPGPWKSTNK
jgi:hypothetical protein